MNVYMFKISLLVSLILALAVFSAKFTHLDWQVWVIFSIVFAAGVGVGFIWEGRPKKFTRPKKEVDT